MKRVLVIVGVVGAAGAGAYGQSVLQPERPSLDAIQVGVAYRASFCGAPGSFGAMFDMRVTKALNDHWFEATAGNLDKATGQFDPYAETVRLNYSQLCYVKPIVR